MDVVAILREVFDLDDDEVFRNIRPDGTAVLSVRQPGPVLVKVHTNPAKEKAAFSPLWAAESEDSRVALTVTVTGEARVDMQEQVCDRDELVAFLSVACQDPEPGSVAAILAQDIQWYTPSLGGRPVAEPAKRHLLRVVRVGNKRLWSFAIMLGNRVYNPDDLRCMDAYFHTEQGAKQAAEAAYRGLLAGERRGSARFDDVLAELPLDSF